MTIIIRLMRTNGHKGGALAVLFGLMQLSGCGPTGEGHTISVEGPTLFYRSGAVQLVDLSDGRTTFGFLVSPALEELKTESVFAGVAKDCRVVVYRVRAEGRLAREHSIYATKLRVVRRYTRSQLDEEVRNIGIEALEDPRVCPSA